VKAGVVADTDDAPGKQGQVDDVGVVIVGVEIRGLSIFWPWMNRFLRGLVILRESEDARRRSERPG